MTNEEALDIMERQLECDNDNCPEPRTSCSECPYNVDAIDYARARKMAIEALSNRCASSEQAGTKPNQPEIGSIHSQTTGNDTDRTTDDQCCNWAKMIDLKKRTITERLIIANSLIAGAIADSDNNQFHDSAKTTDDVPDINVGDTISRQAAIDALKEWGLIDGLSEGQAVEILEDEEKVPPAQPEQRWIPVSERLPEDEYVLISKIPSKISGSKWSVDIAIRIADPRSRKIQWRDSGFGVIQDNKVLAWMPLPEPYQEGEQDG